jgi:hypothetical protein
MTLEPLTVVIPLKSTPEQAFDAFTDKVDEWWPTQSHSVGISENKVPPERVVIEKLVGGRIYELSPAGVTRIWGHITDWEPRKSLGFTWHPGKASELATNVNVRFDPGDNGGSVITLVHTGWEVLGNAEKETRNNYVSGWQSNLANHFVPFTNARTGNSV